MKLSKEETLFLQELLEFHQGNDTIFINDDDVENVQVSLLKRLSKLAEISLIAKVKDKEICFPVESEVELQKLYELHYSTPHIVDIAGFHRHWRTTLESQAKIVTPTFNGHFSIHSLSLSGALIGDQRYSFDTIKAYLERQVVTLIPHPDEDPISLFVSQVRPRDFGKFVLVFDELTQSSPTLKNFLLRAFLATQK
ncbi:hypothetical protein PALB_34820 [Pseudoalteromonas luteoviolacea B = ATCC 29581]|nr:hypothetical protein PALB_34820 [Pseudoalteromonas luteoviolacea B = ATCC 29581]